MTPDFLLVCRPGLPPAEALLPYLRRIDAARHYTNRGALVRELESRLAHRFGLADGALRSASNGTSAIEIAIAAHAGPATAARPLALIPAHTFAATALAAERLGYRPVFADVDPQTWALDPEAVPRHPDLDRIGLILTVAPFGRLPDLAGAEALQRRTGIPVVIDAAASFEQFLDRPGLASASVPLTLSFHATKSFSSGEGGAVLWADSDGQDRVVRAANFGFNLSRRAQSTGTNAKMSEYHAAVGLAMLDGFDQRRADYRAAIALWRQIGASLPGRLHSGPDLASNYILWEWDDPAVIAAAERSLTDRGIDSRRWYEAGLHRHPHFAPAGSPAQPVTEHLAACLLGLPMAHDITPAQIERVVAAIRASLAEAA